MEITKGTVNQIGRSKNVDIKKLQKIIEKKLVNLGKDDPNNELEKLLKIQKILKEEPGIFFKIPMSQAKEILKYIVKEKEILDVYTELISLENFNEMKDSFKI